jgi:hypothetical protein
VPAAPLLLPAAAPVDAELVPATSVVTPPPVLVGASPEVDAAVLASPPLASPLLPALTVVAVVAAVVKPVADPWRSPSGLHAATTTTHNRGIRMARIFAPRAATVKQRRPAPPGDDRLITAA